VKNEKMGLAVIIFDFATIAILINLFVFQLLNAQTSSQTVILKEGFNFISFTVVPSITAQQLIQQYQNIEDIYFYNPFAGSFLSYNDGNLSALGSGKGYIIKAKSQTEISITGEAITNTSDIILKPGFNLVGFSKISGTTKFKEFVEKSNKIQGIYKWNSGSGSFIQVIRNNNATMVELLDGVDPAISSGSSYFIKVTQETVISFDQEYIKIDGEITQNKIQSLSLSKQYDNVNAGSNYDLNKIIINADYSNNDTKVINGVLWSVNSGNGKIENNQYFNSLETGTVILRASYTENNVSIYADLNLSIIAPPQILEMKSAILNQNGGEIKLDSQISYAVLPGALNDSAEVIIAKINNYNELYKDKPIIRLNLTVIFHSVN